MIVQRSFFLRFVLLGVLVPLGFGRDAGTVPLTVVIDLPVGGKFSSQELTGALKVTTLGRDELGWPVVQQPPLTIERDEQALLGSCQVPRGDQVRISVYLPPYPLVERVIDLDLVAPVNRVQVKLGEPVRVRTLSVLVVLPSDAPKSAASSSSFQVRLLGPLTGHTLDWAPMRRSRTGLVAPVGTYDVDVEGVTHPYCVSGPPSYEWMIPVRRHVVVEGDAGGEVGVPIYLRPARGGRLGLRIVPPDSLAEASVLARYKLPIPDGRIRIGKHYTAKPKGLVRAMLVSIDGESRHHLSWGWPELTYFKPWERIPMGRDVVQITPVPSGRYEIILKGCGIEELRQKVTLVDGEVLELKLKPRARVR